MLDEFKKFTLRGNVVDMAIGIIIGGAFGTIAKSLVDDIIMPPIGLLVGNIDFEDLFIVLKSGSENPGPYETVELAQEAGAVTINYGLFINNVVSFILIAIAMFLLIRAINRMYQQEQKQDQPSEPTQKKCTYCQSTIPIAASRCPACTSHLTVEEN